MRDSLGVPPDDVSTRLWSVIEQAMNTLFEPPSNVHKIMSMVHDMLATLHHRDRARLGDLFPVRKARKVKL